MVECCGLLHKGAMHKRPLGRIGPHVSALGLGCMGMSEFYGSFDQEQSLATLRKADEIGVDFLDTADIYGNGTNELLLGEAFRTIQGLRQRVVLASKFGIVRDANGAFTGVDGSPGYVKKACDASLKRLGVETIDLYYQHRKDPQVPIEDTVGAMAELVQAGKVRYLGLSEVGAETLRRAHTVHPITALQTEYSLWTRDIEAEILPACRTLGTTLVAYSPLGRGFLTGAIQKPEDLEEDDWRRSNPRFQGEAFQANLKLVDEIRAVATAKDCTPAQLALAWVLLQGTNVIPIPGTRSSKRLEENIGATEVSLSADEIARLESVFETHAAAGSRYPEPAMTLLGQ